MNDKQYSKMSGQDKHRYLQQKKSSRYDTMEQTKKDMTIWNRPPYGGLMKKEEKRMEKCKDCNHTACTEAQHCECCMECKYKENCESRCRRRE